MGKIIVIEGTDCSGKATQSELLKQKLEKMGKKVIELSFPMYETPTGKIIGGPYLGKASICEGWFQEGASNVPPKVAALYYAADRLYNIATINKYLNDDYIVILDRYVYSNMGHQSGKIKDKNERLKMFKWLEKLEFDLLELPDADIKLFLHMPYEYSKNLQHNRKELDQHETSKEHIINAENAYLEMCELFNFKKVECVKDNKIRDIEDINEEIFKLIKDLI